MVEDFSDQFEKLEKPETMKFIGAMKRWGIDPKDCPTFFSIWVLPSSQFFYNILFCILEFLYVIGCEFI
ncbi:hypothetical protein RchiOBHm_Chr3g0486041 [Rosa chinensis]|uniref:Uncharacterized protein n=1 Tax=Rosa chinensis TaxID=74649 RepID=A0A2P6RF44_ROSCH|nr:hypothetical protein RchiOBHm_Chr3g0486041 [Rosa chinensis]